MYSDTGHGIPKFIDANTSQANLGHLVNDCVIPVFAKDNERTIAHHEFIETANNAVEMAFPGVKKDLAIAVSHMIKGRVPEAAHKAAKDLLEHETTMYYERMAFAITLDEAIAVNGHQHSITIGGVRAYNNENLNSRKKMETFQVFVGLQNFVCTNLAISTESFNQSLQVSSHAELHNGIMSMIAGYNRNNHVEILERWAQVHMSEHQFAQMLGKARIYPYHPNKKNLPVIEFNDSIVSAVAKSYYQDKTFKGNGSISMYNLYNLLTGAVKNSYIDTFLPRNANAHEFTKGLSAAISGDDTTYEWFLS